MTVGDKQRVLNQLFEDIKAKYKGYRCVECKQTPWPAWINGTHTPRCRCGTEFQVEPIPNFIKAREAQMLERQTANPENMLARVEKANSAGLFPNKANPQQVELMARAAMAYNLDPLMQELILYQGKPYITIDGRRRLDARAGHHPTIRFRALRDDEKQILKDFDALDDKDVTLVCELTTEWGNTVEGMGRVLASERKGAPDLPVVKRPIEMAQKRAEARARKMAYGPNPIPAGLEGLVVLDESETIEGESRVLAPEPSQEAVTAPPKPEGDPKPPKPTAPTGMRGTWPSLKFYVEGQGWKWEEFEQVVLGATQAEFSAAGGTPQTAYTRFINWQEQQGAAEEEGTMEDQVAQLEQEFQEQMV